MTVENTNTEISYTGNGSVTSFAYDFLVYNDEHIFVYLDDVEQGTGFYVTGLGNDSGGTVEFDVAPANGVNVLIIRDVPNTQLIEYQEYGPFDAKTNERGLDLAAMRSIQLANSIADFMNKVPLAPENNIVSFDSNGDAKDSGVDVNSIGDGSNKMDKIPSASDGNIVLFDATGNSKDSGINIAAISGSITTVADLKATDLSVGSLVRTVSYYENWNSLYAPSGGSYYLISTLQEIRDTIDDQLWVPDELGDHTLNNGLIAWLQVTGVAYVTQYGARNDKTTDSAASFQAAINANGELYIDDGEYAIANQIELKSNFKMSASSNAILRPTADNFVMFNYSNAMASGSNIILDNIFASDFDGSSVGVTMIRLSDLGPGVEIRSPKATQLEKMIEIAENSFGAKIYSPNAFRVPYPIVTGSTGSVGTVDVYSPNFDNSVSVAGGSGVGIGIDFLASGSVYGGYIQGFDTGVKFTGRGSVHATYFESCNNEGVLFDGAFGVTCINPFFFGFDGDAFFRGRNSESVKIINPVMVNNTATTGLFDFDDTNNSCTYEYATNNAKTLNPVIGITNGIMPNSVVTNARKQLTIQRKDTNIFLPVDVFAEVQGEFPSLMTITADISALEKDGFVATVADTFKCTVKIGPTLTISPVQKLAEHTVKVFNSNYEIDIIMEVVAQGASGVRVRCYIDTSGAITPSIADMRINMDVVTTGDQVRVTELN